jgi:hypothetical protein
MEEQVGVAIRMQRKKKLGTTLEGHFGFQSIDQRSNRKNETHRMGHSINNFSESTQLKTVASSRPNATKRAERKRERREREDKQRHGIYVFYTV